MEIPARVLVVKLADIGDVLTATPALRALRSSFPASHIAVLVTPGSAAVLSDLPYLDDLIVFDKFRYDRPWDALRLPSLASARDFYRALRAGRYDTVLILHHLTTRWGSLKYAALALGSGAERRLGLDNGRGWFLTRWSPDQGFGVEHEVEYWLDVAGLLGAHTDDRRLEIAVSDADRQWAGEQLAADGQSTEAEERWIAVHPGSGDFIPSRRWPAEHFAQVADALAERYSARIVLVGGPGEEALADAVAGQMEKKPLNLAGKTTVKQLAALLARCALFVGGDSGVMHVAVAVGTPVVALFGPTNEDAWGPYTPEGSGLRSQVVRAAGTRPVMYVGGVLGRERGVAGAKAMAAITPEMVMAAAEKLF
jgi:lipopolysaccharide heptosyltransferase II